MGKDFRSARSPNAAAVKRLRGQFSEARLVVAGKSRWAKPDAWAAAATDELSRPAFANSARANSSRIDLRYAIGVALRKRRKPVCSARVLTPAMPVKSTSVIASRACCSRLGRAPRTRGGSHADKFTGKIRVPGRHRAFEGARRCRKPNKSGARARAKNRGGADIERDRQIPRALVDAIGDAGLFGLWLPKAFDGPELNLVDYIRVIEELARADGSVAWCVTVAASLARIAGYLQPDIALRVFGGGRTVVAGTINPTGKAFTVDGGYRVTGRWAYGSGILHSTWTLGNCIVHDRDGPRRGSSGAPELRLVIFPTGAVEVIDTWHVSGLRGTGSHDYRVADLFVRDDHSILCFDAMPLQPGTLYAVPMITVLSVAIAAVPLGIARAAIDTAVELAQVKTPGLPSLHGSSLLLRDKPTFQAAVGRAEALLGSARSFLATVGDLWDEVSSGVAASMKGRAMVRLACTQAAQSAAQAVDLMYNAGGSTSLYETSRLERCFRDVHACTQHIATSTDSYELGGRVMLGFDSGRSQF